VKFIAKQKKSYFFYCIVILGLIAVLFSHPFLRFPYDVHHHLHFMDGIIRNEYAIPSGRHLWHFIWVYLFDIFKMTEYTDYFLRIKVIHVVQTYIALFALYYFSHVVIRNLFKQIDALDAKYLSLWSVVIWVTIFATFSVYYHQVWLMWYSTNYHVTLPLFWYMLALTLVLVWEKTTLLKKVFYVFQIVLLTRFILQVHSMEYMYYLMHLVVLSIVFVDRWWGFVKRFYFIVLSIVGLVIYFMVVYQPDKSKLFDYLFSAKFSELMQEIVKQGNHLIHGFNRASASINELMVTIGFMTIGMVSYLIWQKIHSQKSGLNMRVFLYLVFSSLFVVLPLYRYSGGLFAVITDMFVVNRIYYSSSLFILLPVGVYFFVRDQKYLFVRYNMAIVVVLLSVTLFSAYNTLYTHNYYKNLISIYNSYSPQKVGFHLSSKQIEQIYHKIAYYESKYQDKEIVYYARVDVAYLLKYMFHKKNVYGNGAPRAKFDHEEVYRKRKSNQMYNHVLFETPKGFPSYEPFK
jgi:hypothetical protein